MWGDVCTCTSSFIWLQKCLNHFHLRSLALQAFVDVFQGCYKDGTNGTRDCRYFAPLHILLRLVCWLIFAVTKDDFRFAFYLCVMLSVYLILFIAAHPYKKSVYNRTDTFLIVVLLLLFVSFLYDSSPQQYSTWPIFILFAFVFIFYICYGCYWAIKHFKSFLRLRRYFEL